MKIRRLLDLTQTSLCEYPLKRKGKGIVSQGGNVKEHGKQNRQRSRTHLCVDVRYLLDRAPFPRAPVLSGYDAAVSALPELLDELVLRVDNKGRVQSGETVSLHGTVRVEGDKDGGMKQGTNDSSIIYPFTRNLETERLRVLGLMTIDRGAILYCHRTGRPSIHRVGCL